jgi:hypothetical protein
LLNRYSFEDIKLTIVMKNRLIHNRETIEFSNSEDILTVTYIPNDYSGRPIFLIIFNTITIGTYKTLKATENKINQMCNKYNMIEINLDM